MKKTTKQASSGEARRARPPSSAKSLTVKERQAVACPLCGGTLYSVREQRTVAIGRRRVTIDDQFHRCDKCENILYAPGEADASLRRAADVVRPEDNLLAPEEIRGIREKLGLT